MLDHRMTGKSELAGHLHPLVAGGDGGEGDAGIHVVALGAVEAPEKIEMPPGAAELAVGDGLQADLLLLLDDPLDLAILHRLEVGGADLTLGAFFPRLLQRSGPQEAADVVGTERGLGSFHCFTPGHIRRIANSEQRIEESPFATRYSLLAILAPDLVGNLHDPPQLRPLLVLGQDITLLGGGEAALRREAELIEVDEPRGLVDAALELVLGFERPALRGDEPEHDHLALGYETQRREAARAVAVVFHEIGVDVDLVEQDLGHRLVAAGRDEGRLKVATAQMHRLGHIGRDIGQRSVDHAGIDVGKRFRILAAVGDEGAQLGVAEIGEIDLVELEIAAAGVAAGTQRLAVALAEVAIEIVHVGIDLDRHGIAPVAEMQRRGRGNGHFRRRLVRGRFGMRGDEFEMLDHRMRAVATELADHAQHHGLGLRALELDLALAEIGFDAVELAEEIVVPKGAAKLAVSHGTKPRFLLLADDGLDLAVFDRLEFFGGDLAALALGARLLEDGGTQEAPDMIGANRRLGAWHMVLCSGKTVIARAGGRSSHRRSLKSITSVAGYWMPRLRRA